MCGICGSLAFDGQDMAGAVAELVPLMARRGPDDMGLWSDGAGCAFGFRRLAVLDTSAAGHQPMLSEDGRYAIVFNGEVYNFRELRRELEGIGHRFRSSGDTEVVLHALIEWGRSALSRFNGMFALALFDTGEGRLLLARDFAGIKPLYYLLDARGIAFASQYDQILAHPWRDGHAPSPDALALYLRLAFIPAPYAYLQGSHMLEPGAWLEATRDGRIRQGRYFEFPVNPAPELRGADAHQAVDAAVTEAVRRQLVSDVPLGTFLSGGIDSPLVTAKMRAAGIGHLQAFTIGVRGDAVDESGDALQYAAEIGVEHHLRSISADDALAIMDDAIAACGEPFADFSIFPTLLVCKLARERVTVMLSGDGGDELFWGYAPRFAAVVNAAPEYRHPLWLRRARRAGRALVGGKPSTDTTWPSIGAWFRARHAVLRDHVLAEIFPGTPSWPADYRSFDFGGANPDTAAQWCRWNEFTCRMTMILMKVDRASMYHSLEVRVPLLDKAVIDTALRVDWRDCLDPAQQIGKLPLRNALRRHVKYQTRAKRGFTVPMAKWLQGPLRPLFESAVLGRDELAGLPVDRAALARVFKQHLSGESERAWGLWTLLSLALWEERHARSRPRRDRPAATAPLRNAAAAP